MTKGALYMPAKMNPFEVKTKPADRYYMDWQKLYPRPYDKNEVDPYTRLRIILMNGTEYEANWFSHQFHRHCTNNDLRRELAVLRRTEQQQQKRIACLKPIDESILETTIGYEQLAVDLTAILAQREPDAYVVQVMNLALLEDFDHLYRYADLLELERGIHAERLVGCYTEIMPGRPTIAEHRHPVGHVHDLVELVGDDDQGLAVCLHIPHDIEEPVRLLGGQHGGGLIQDQDVCAPVEDLDDLHRLLLRHGHVVDLLVGINGKTIFLTDLQDFGGGGLQIQLALSVQPQDDVFRCGEHVHQLEVLVDHADAAGKGVLGGGNGGGLAVHQDLPFVREVDAGQHIHQCGLAAAVLPQQGEDFVREILADYEEHTDKVWDTNIFGKTLKDLVNEGLAGKIEAMPPDIRKKMRRTITRIVNEGRGGVICILL